MASRISLVVQWLRLHASAAGGTGLIPNAAQTKHKQKQNKANKQKSKLQKKNKKQWLSQKVWASRLQAIKSTQTNGVQLHLMVFAFLLFGENFCSSVSRITWAIAWLMEQSMVNESQESMHLRSSLQPLWASLIAQMVKNLPVTQETLV